MKMTKTKLILELVTLSVLFLTVLGCERSAKDKAVAEAMKAKAELEQIKIVLVRTESEKDQLEKDMASISENWEKAESELTAVTKAHDKLQYQVKQLIDERSAAIAKAKDAQATIQNLSSQLKEKIAEVREFEEWVKELQATIAQLENYIDQIDKRSPEESTQEPDQTSTEEVVDENSV